MVIKNNKHHEHYNRPENITLNDYRAELENYLRLDLGMQGASNYMNSIKDSQLNSGINEIFKCSNELANDYYVMNTSDEAQGFLYCCISEKFIDLIQKDPTHKSAIEHIDVGTSVRGYIKRTNEKIIQMENTMVSWVV